MSETGPTPDELSQRQGVDPEDDLSGYGGGEAERASAIPDLASEPGTDANEADVWDQSLDAGEDDEEEYQR